MPKGRALQPARYRPHPSRRIHLGIEKLEDRSVLSVLFTPGPLAVPAVNRTDIPLGTFNAGGFEEPMLSVDGRDDPGNIAVTSHGGMRVSTNAGGLFVPQTNYPIAAGGGDTWTDFDSKGRLYWTNLDQALGGNRTRVDMAYINPGTGGLVGNVNVVSTPPAGMDDDRQIIAADSNPGSPYVDRLYAAWTRFDAAGDPTVVVARSTDGGANWSAPVQVGFQNEGWVQQCGLSVAPNGDVYVAYHAQREFADDAELVPSGDDGRIYVVRSTDGGRTFDQKTSAFTAGRADVTWNLQTAASGQIPGTDFWTRGSGTPFVLADPARPRNVYVVTADDPDNVHGSGDDSNVVIARSTDNGLTWSRSTISSGPNSSFQLFPTAAIDQFGNIAVAWYDNRRGLKNSGADGVAGNADDNFLLDIYATYSTDGGLTWCPAFRVNDVAINPDQTPVVTHRVDDTTTRIGEYFGIDLFAGTAYLAWVGNVAPNAISSQQVIFDAFPIRGSLTVNGDDDPRFVDEEIFVRSMAGNPAFVEVLIDGERQYAGLWSALTGITVNSLRGRDEISIENVAAGVALTVNAGEGNDIVEVSPAGQNLDSVLGSLTLRGIAGFDELVIHDSANPYSYPGFSQLYNISATAVSRPYRPPGAAPQLPPRWATVQFDQFDTLEIHAGQGADVITLTETENDVEVALNAGAGADVISLGTDSSIPLLFGSLTVDGQDGADTLVLNDKSNNLDFTYSVEAGAGITPERLERTLSEPVVFHGVQRLILKGGGEDDTFHVESTGETLPVTIEGGGGDDQVHLGSESSPPALPGTMKFVGQGGDDTLVIHDESIDFAMLYTIKSATIERRQSAAIEYDATLEDVILKAGSAADTVRLETYTGLTDFTVDGGLGSNALERTQGAANAWSITGANAGELNSVVEFSRIGKLTGSAGRDDFVFGDRDTVSGIVDGGDGTDTLDFSAYTAAIRVDLAKGTATPSGGVRRIENATGGSVADILRGNGFDNVLRGGGGDDVLIGAAGIDSLFGNSGRNLLIGGKGGDTLWGGADDDILIDGTTDYDGNNTALFAVFAEWGDLLADYATRVDQIRRLGVSNGKYFLNATTVDHDTDADTLQGGGFAGLNWFFADDLDDIPFRGDDEQLN